MSCQRFGGWLVAWGSPESGGYSVAVGPFVVGYQYAGPRARYMFSCGFRWSSGDYRLVGSG